ncbi:putative crinkler family protein [Gigaspora margarita]|uniref:Putative crinkler family protein n=1 Tax=Gigaspora margarita TaxID=4874 RepID=A0A8H4AZ31_GIGMA|nr:putative crinkler family protein [Gigaspora margarita]
MYDPLKILKEEIHHLGFNSVERVHLLTYFTKNIEKIIVAVSCLIDLTDGNKHGYLRSLISKPGLLYVKPEPLLRTSGANWEYQTHSSLKHILQRKIKKHYENFLLGRFDKMLLPLYLFLTSASTGKSCNANEFHLIAISCLLAQEDKDLLTKINEAWVFFVSYENGTSL